MVHALTEAARVAQTTVLDIRPLIEPPEIWVRDQAGADTRCGGLQRKPDAPPSHISAANAMAQVVAEGLFAIEKVERFEWIDVYESLDELIEAVAEEWENWLIEEDVSLKLVREMERAGRGAQPFIRQGIQAQVLKKIAVSALITQAILSIYCAARLLL